MEGLCCLGKYKEAKKLGWGWRGFSGAKKKGLGGLGEGRRRFFFKKKKIKLF